MTMVQFKICEPGWPCCQSSAGPFGRRSLTYTGQRGQGKSSSHPWGGLPVSSPFTNFNPPPGEHSAYFFFFFYRGEMWIPEKVKKCMQGHVITKWGLIWQSLLFVWHHDLSSSSKEQWKRSHRWKYPWRKSDLIDKYWPSPFTSSFPITLDNGLFIVSEAYACVRRVLEESNLCGRPPGIGNRKSAHADSSRKFSPFCEICACQVVMR